MIKEVQELYDDEDNVVHLKAAMHFRCNLETLEEVACQEGRSPSAGVYRRL